MSSQTSQRWVNLLPRITRYVPNRLSEPLRDLPQPIDKKTIRKLMSVQQALNPLHRTLVHYMPRYLLDLDLLPGQSHGELLEGTYLFADVTGFTALTELLSKQGHNRGRELMNQIMNQLFTAVLDPLAASGGDLLIFAGDAALAYFPQQKNGDEDNVNDLLQAVRAAFRIQRALAPFADLETEFGQSSLTMSMGIERGLAYAGVVGTSKRMELLVSGGAIEKTIQAEESGEATQIMLGAEAKAIGEKYFTMTGNRVIDDLGDDLDDYEIILPTRKRGRMAILAADIDEILDSLEHSLEQVERLAPFLPEDQLAQLVNAGRYRQLEPEFRPVAVQFINVVGFEALALKEGTEIATAAFQRYFVLAQEIVSRHEGIISQIDAYSKGFFFVNTFGVPKAHEGTKKYAISAALALDQALEQVNREFGLDLKQCGGITHGLTFNGEIGAKFRRESVIAGPAVNRAARLMSKADFGQVIVDSDIWSDVQSAFVGEKVAAVNLKGIEGPVVIINVHNMRLGTRLQPLDRPPVGRDEERAKLSNSLEQLYSSQQGSCWLLSGETGIGKTTLLADLAHQARKKGALVLVGQCQPHGKHIPLFPWLDLLMSWLDDDDTLKSKKSILRQRLASKLKRLGLSASEGALADLLSLPKVAPPSQKEEKKSPARPKASLSLLNRRMEQQQQPKQQRGGLSALLSNRLEQQENPQQTLWQRLEERISGPKIIINLLAALAKQHSLVVLLEDIHWMDPESIALWNEIKKEALPLMMGVSSHTPLPEEETLLQLPLPALPEKALRQVASRILGAESLDESLGNWITHQANGNSLYAEKICEAIISEDAVLVDRKTGEARWSGLTPSLPVSLHELLLARLDTLPLNQQDVLKRGAVVGVMFQYGAITKLAQRRLTKTEIQTGLSGAQRAELITNSQEESYLFKHPLMCETIYETLSFAQRQEWHTMIGDWLKEQEASLELMAHHYLLGKDVQKATEFGFRAADKARQRGVYRGALEYYEQVLSLSQLSPEARGKAIEGSADIMALQGNYQEAIQAYDSAIVLDRASAREKQGLLQGNLETLEQIKFAPLLSPWAEGAKACLMAQKGQYKTAEDVIQQALTKTEDATALSALKSLAQNLAHTSYITWLDQAVHAIL